MKRILWLIIILILCSIYVNLPEIAGKLSVPALKKEIKFASFSGKFPLKLGLDLQGGTQLVLETQMQKIDTQDRDRALESAREVIERRVNLYGVSEAVVQESKISEQRRILVDLPGIKDASSAANLVGKTAQLEFREVSATESADASSTAQIMVVLNAKPTGLTGADLKKAQVTYGSSRQANAGPQVSIEFTPEGAKKFADLTRRNLGKPLPIFLDDQVLTYPIVQSEILDGNAVITGNFNAQAAKELAIQLNAGALPVPINIIEQRSIGASLGQESVNKSVVAGVIGFLTIATFMAFYYGGLGLIADLALIIYALFVLSIFRTGLFILPPVTLTLAGVAGFVLSVGMAVDANILIFERIKEERRWGKPNQQALEFGFKRAWSSIRDSNISSLITAAILYFLGTGSVRGFALTLAIGVLVSMFTAITVTKTILRMVVK